ncbi:GNAT family N-acetyltransferase [Pseudomonas floridensis]|uniref:GNAT family N-acetyltransferase n=1 Tax=Pseudomonas floridensis TaxID=1958950 RepID=A0A1X0N2T6_9PSED|nr:GNAT family N-acetyltransferase [Pseudomonas floridensis]ORC57823.1 GNAT family N-acetyltransferase [Pseudomonas floridensis]
MHKPQPPLIYRAPRKSDLDRLFAIYSDPRTNLFNPAGPLSSVQEAQQLLTRWLDHWEEHGFGWWAITTSEAPEHVIGFGGVAYLNYLTERRANLGYRFAVEAWGKGYATRVGRAALDKAFGRLCLPEVFGLVRPDHKASIRVLEKIGMRPIGELDDVPGKPSSLVFNIKCPVPDSG